MTLQKQEVEVPINGGQDAKKSTELGDPSTMLSVTNLRWDRIGELEKRPTYASTATPAAPSGANYTDATAEAIFARGDEVFALTSDFGVARVDPDDPTALLYASREVTLSGSAGAVLKYAPKACRVSRRFIERSQFNRSNEGILQVASAVYNGVLVVAWIESGETYRLHLKALDLATGRVINQTEHVTVSSPRCDVNAVPYSEVGKEGVLVTYAGGSAAPYTIETVRWNDTARTFVADSTLTTDAHSATHAIAEDAENKNVYFGYVSNSGALPLLTQHGTVAMIAGGTSTQHTATHSATHIAFVVGPTRTLIASNSNSTAYAEVFGSPANVTTAFTASTETFYGVTASQEVSGGVSNNAIIYVNAQGTGTPVTQRVRVVSADFSTTTVSASFSRTLPNAWASVAAWTYGGRSYCGFSTNITYGLMTSLIVARHAKSDATSSVYRFDAIARLCHDRFFSPDVGIRGGTQSVSVVGNKVYLVNTADISPTPTAYDGGYLPQSLFLGTIEFREDGALPLPSVEIDDTTMVAGGVLWTWDGDTPCEGHFLSRPVVTVDTSNAGTPTATTGHSVMARWRYVDSKGRLYRSQPSVAVNTGAFTTQRVDVYVTKPPFRAGEEDTAQELEPEVYITEDGGSVYYLATTGSSDRKKDWDLVDGRDTCWKYELNTATLADLDMPQLDTTGADGGELPPEPTPAFRDITRVGDRLFAIDAEDTSRVWFTKPFVAGYAPEWSTVCTLFIGDDCVAVRDMGGVPTVFGARGIHQIYGEGPDSTGNGSFSPARRLPYEVGCIDSLVCKTSLGTVFRGRRGYYLLGNDLSLQPFGLPIDQTTRVASTSGYAYARIVNDEVHNEIRVIDVESGHYYVFNTVESKWSEWLQSTTAQKAVDACVADGRVWYLHDTGSTRLIRREYGVDESGYNTSDESWTIGTSWLKLDGVAGQIRLWRAWLSLALPSDSSDISNVTVSYSTDYGQAVKQTFVWTGAELDALYDFSAGDVTAQLAMVPAQQVAKAVKFAITVTFTGASAGPRPLGLRLQFGVRDTKSKRTRPGVK